MDSVIDDTTDYMVGEGGIMATEVACMGVHAVVVNPEARQGDGSYTFGVFQYLS